MTKYLLIVVALLTCHCGDPPMGVVVDVESRNDAISAAVVIPKLIDETGGYVDLPFESISTIYSRPDYQYANRGMHRYSGKTITVVLTIGDDPDSIVVDSVQPRSHTLDMFTLYVGGNISDNGYYQNKPPLRTIYLPSYQDTLYIYLEVGNTSFM
jgi:hypothetical protein